MFMKIEKIIHDDIAVRTWMIYDSLKCATRIHKYKISNNQLIFKFNALNRKSNRMWWIISGK